MHPPSSAQHKWILTAIDYLTKWIEATPSRLAMDVVIIKFLETNILSRFGCSNKLIIDNVAGFRYKKMIYFCNKYHITLGQSTAYYPQGNGLAEPSNKSLVNIIMKLLADNKKSWHNKLINALWDDRLTTKKSIGMSSYQPVYGMDAIFPSSLGVPSMKIIQEFQVEPNNIQRRIDQTIQLQQSRVLKRDSRREDKGKNGKFDNLWMGPYVIYAFRGYYAFFLKHLDGTEMPSGPVNG
eukprot:PITA_01553